MKFSILIATVTERQAMFTALFDEFIRQIVVGGYTKEVEVLFDQDNKEISVGAKRQKLLKRAKGEYIVFFDDDDLPYPYYVMKVMEAIEKGPDCVGIIVNMTTNGRNFQRCCHSLKYKVWETRKDGFNYVRNVTHFNPVKRKLALKVGFSDSRFGEDKEYSDKLTPLCKKEEFIRDPIFHYRFNNIQSHNVKYGIKNAS